MRKTKGFSLMEMMVVVGIISILGAIAIPNLLAARRSANESAAQTGLKIIATAIETYSSVNNGDYAPANNTVSDSYLRTETPPYLTEDYCGETKNGYIYTCDIDKSTYTISAAASTCGTSGNKDYSITDGGELTSAACS